MATRRGSARLAISSPWGPTPAAQAQQGANLDEELAAFVRRRKDLLTVGALGITDQGGGQPVVQPQPQSVGDMLQVGKFAVDVSQSIAQGAQAQAQATKEELDRTKAQASEAFEAGQQQTLTVWKMMDDRDARAEARQQALEEAMRQQTDALKAELQQTRDELREAKSQQQMAELNAKIDKLTEAHSQQLAAANARAEKAEQIATEARRPKSPEEMALELIRGGADPQSPQVRHLLGYGEPGQETPQERWQRLHMDKVEDEIVDERARRRALQTNAIEHDAAVKAGQRKIYDHVDKAMNLLEKWLEGNVGGGGNEANGKAGLPHNGFGGTMEEMAAQAQQIAAAQAAQAAQQGGAE